MNVAWFLCLFIVFFVHVYFLFQYRHPFNSYSLEQTIQTASHRCESFVWCNPKIALRPNCNVCTPSVKFRSYNFRLTVGQWILQRIQKKKTKTKWDEFSLLPFFHHKFTHNVCWFYIFFLLVLWIFAPLCITVVKIKCKRIISVFNCSSSLIGYIIIIATVIRELNHL